MGYDVVVVGASLAGCTAARLYAQRGARVALVEKRPDPAAYKTVCTHFVQPSATPVVEKLGLAPLLEERGARHNSLAVWTPHGGWIRPDDEPFGYNVTRRTMDPLLRDLASGTDGVDFLPGRTVTALSGGSARPDGVVVRDRDGGMDTLRAPLVVGADGRGTLVARLAGIPGRVRANARFFYWAYWRGVEPDTERSRMWLLEPDCAYTFPMEDGLTLVLVAPHRSRMDAFRADLEGEYHRLLASLPDGPRFDGATRESKLLGKLDAPNVWRPAARPGVALVGDAAQASDPLLGVGCGWAFQSADWLVAATGDAVAAGDPAAIDRGLRRYRRTHARRLVPHHLLIADIATGRPAIAFERMFFRAATRDPKVRRAFAEVGARSRSPALFYRPDILARVVRAGRRRATSPAAP